MRKHLNSYLFSPLSWILTITLLTLFLSIVLFLTPFGVKILANIADSALKELTIEGVSGSLLTGLHIDKVVWADGDSISLDNVDLKIKHFDTSRGRLLADNVTAGRLNINLANTNTGEKGGDITSLPDFGLPLNLNANLIQLDSLQITQNIPDDAQSRDLLFEIKNIQLVKATITDGKLLFRKLLGSPIIMGEPLKINLKEGRLNMNQPHDLITAGGITFKHSEIGDLTGEVQLTGTLTDYRFKGLVKHQNKILGKQTIDLLGQGNYKRVHFEKVKFNGDHGALKANGRLLWVPEVTWNFLLEGDQLSTRKFLPEWPATIDTKLRYKGSYIDKRLENIITIDSLEGMLREYTIKAQGRVNEREGVISTEDLDLQLGDNHIQLTGRANEPFNLSWKVDAKNIKQVLPKNLANLNISGKVKGSGYLKGRLSKPQINVNISADNLSYKEFKQGKETLFLKGKLAFDNSALQLRDLMLKTGSNEIQASGQASEPFNLNWKIKANNLRQISPLITGRVNGSGQLKGTLKKPNIKLKIATNNLSYNGIKQGKDTLFLEGDLGMDNDTIQLENLSAKSGVNQVTASGQASEPFNLNWRVNANNLRQLSPQLAGRLKGNGHLKGSIKKPEVKIKLSANNLAYKDIKQGKETLHLEGDLGMDNDIIRLKNLSAKSGANQITASGQASEPFNLNWSVNANNLKQLSPQLAGKVKGNGQLKGSIKKPEIKIKLAANNLAYKDIKQGKETLHLNGNLGLVNDVIHLKNLTASSGKNTINISGQASEPMNLQLKVKAQNLRQISPQLAGRLRGEVKIKGGYQSPTIKASLVASKLRYQTYSFAQKELSANAEIKIVKGVPIIKNLALKAGNNHIKISGRASSPYNLKWDINSKNLRQLIPELSGQLISKGQLQGTIERPVINAAIDGKRLRYKEFKLGSIKGNAQTKKGAYYLKADITNLQTADQKIKRGKLEVNGRLENHAIKLFADHEMGKVSLKANGGWLNQKWKGRLQSLSLKNTKAGNWRLQKPTSINLSQNGFSTSKFCLSSNKTQTCSKLAWSKASGIKAKGTLRKTPLAIFKPLLPKGVILSGSVSGRYDIKQNRGKPVGTVNVTFPNSNFSFKNAQGDEQILAYRNAELNATINNQTIIAKAKVKIVNRGELTAQATIKLSPKNGRSTINGSAIFDSPNINWAQRYIPHSRGLRGKLSSEVTFSGLLNRPQFKAKADLKNAYLRLPEAGTELTNINIKVRSDRPGKAAINGKMLMGKGALNITGALDARDLNRWKATLKISGNNIRFMNTNEIKATMSPNLTIAITPKVINILGKVVIPQALINLKEIPATSIDESDDVYVIGERKPGEQVSAVKIKPKVLIELGDKVRINAFGLRAKLSGRVNISHNHRDILANGSLRVTDGKYQAYGQNLDINNGRLIFNGSPKIIGMDIRATRKVEKYLVGVHLGGNLLNPKSKIFSNPGLPESEALSFLLTGHSLSSSSGRDSALLMSAVRGLGITGNDSLLHNIGSSLGLDDVSIVTSSKLKNSKISLGKRLGPKLYIRYLVGLSDTAQKIAIEYEINKRLSLEAQTESDKYGFDFIYEFERD